jgi:hypothetical protein
MYADLSRILLFISRLQGLPAPPGKPILIPGEEDSQPDVVGIRWERSPSNGGSSIIGYHVEHRKMGSPNWVRSAPVLCTFPELTLSGLEPGWRYQFRIKAQNALGLSEPSELSDPLTVTLQRTASIAPRFDAELRDFVALEGEQVCFIIYIEKSCRCPVDSHLHLTRINNLEFEALIIYNFHSFCSFREMEC